MSSRMELRSFKSGVWPVAIVDCPGIWATKGMQTLVLLPPILGPTGTLLLHRLAFTYPSQWTTEALAAQLGVSPSKVLDALGRLVQWRFVSVEDDVLAVPSRLGPLSRQDQERLPASLRRVHDLLAVARGNQVTG